MIAFKFTKLFNLRYFLKGGKGLRVDDLVDK